MCRYVRSLCLWWSSPSAALFCGAAELITQCMGGIFFLAQASHVALSDMELSEASQRCWSILCSYQVQNKKNGEGKYDKKQNSISEMMHNQRCCLDHWLWLVHTCVVITWWSAHVNEPSQVNRHGQNILSGLYNLKYSAFPKESVIFSE